MRIDGKLSQTVYRKIDSCGTNRAKILSARQKQGLKGKIPYKDEPLVEAATTDAFHSKNSVFGFIKDTFCYRIEMCSVPQVESGYGRSGNSRPGTLSEKQVKVGLLRLLKKQSPKDWGGRESTTYSPPS